MSDPIEPRPRAEHSLNMIARVDRADALRVMLPVAELAVCEAERAGAMPDDRPQLVLDTIGRFVRGEATRAQSKREIDALRIGANPPGHITNARVTMFAYAAAQELVGVFERTGRVEKWHRLANAMVWTRLGAFQVLTEMGESEDAAEARVARVISDAMEQPATAPQRREKRNKR